jgi:NAD+ kinase
VIAKNARVESPAVIEVADTKMVRIVGIISRPRREDIARVVPPLLEWLRAHGAETICDLETGECVGGLAGRTIERQELPEHVDLLIVLGGDGTLLSAARLAAERRVPILAVNLGGLGFLTTVSQDELFPILEEIFANKHRISERVMLASEVVRGGSIIRQQMALNDAVLNKEALARIMDWELRVDGEYVATYKADGLIVATPTGSTAYSLSAGGPIVYPIVDAFVVTPICPHTLTNRPIVIPDSVTIEIGFQSGENNAFLTLDGQIGIELTQGDRVVLHRAPNRLRLVRPAKKTYYEILRNKLKWGER